MGGNLRLGAAGLDRKQWSNAGPMRTIFKEGFAAAGLPYFNPHCFRKTLALLGGQVCKFARGSCRLAALGPCFVFTRDLHTDLKADYILANPPFNISDWLGELLRSDARWKYGTPPVGNANYAWIQHFIHHLAPPNGKGGGIAAFVMANGSLSSTTGGEGEIRKAIVEADLVDCIIGMPPQLFLTTGIPVCLWFVTRDKSGKSLDNGRGGRNRAGETLFIDARDMGQMESRTLRFLTGRDHPSSPPPAETDIGRIVSTYHAWRGEKGAGDYADIKGFCKAAKLEDIRKYRHVLTPGTYVGSVMRKADNERFEEKMERLVIVAHLAISVALSIGSRSRFLVNSMFCDCSSRQFSTSV